MWNNFMNLANGFHNFKSVFIHLFLNCISDCVHIPLYFAIRPGKRSRSGSKKTELLQGLNFSNC